jgi:hypothetical protein
VAETKIHRPLASNTMQRYGQLILKRAKANRDAEAAEAREKAEKEKKKGVKENVTEGGITLGKIHDELVWKRGADPIKGKWHRKVIKTQDEVIKAIQELVLAKFKKKINSKSALWIANDLIPELRFTDDQDRIKKEGVAEGTDNDSVFKKWRDELGTDRKTTLDIVEPKSSYTSTSSPRPSEKKCPHCGGDMVSEELMNEKKDACYYKVKSRYKVWPSAYASGALVKCRKVGAKNWGKKSKVKESQQPVKTKARAMYGKGLQNLLDQWVLKSTQRDTALYMGQNKKAIALSNEIKQIKDEVLAMDSGKEAFDQLLAWVKAKNASK